MALIYDPLATEQLKEMRAIVGSLYIDAIWAQRQIEQATRNVEAAEHWRKSFPAWGRLFAHTVKTLQPQSADIIPMTGRTPNSKVA